MSSENSPSLRVEEVGEEEDMRVPFDQQFFGVLMLPAQCLFALVIGLSAGHVLCVSWSIHHDFWWIRVWHRVLVAEADPRPLSFGERVGAVKYWRVGKWRVRIV